MSFITCTKNTDILNNRNVWIIRLPNKFNEQYCLLLSKVSEAIAPNTTGNVVGPGASMRQFVEAQKNVRFIINGGFNHYRKNFYDWPHQEFNIGDPVGITKIREHYFEDFLDIEHYGFFVQESKDSAWRIVKYNELNKNAKYILSCTPLLIFEGIKQEIPNHKVLPIDTVNPPSYLGHSNAFHPRTAVGIKNNEIFFVLVEHLGCTIEDLQSIGLHLGLEYFLNLDGGGSSQYLLWQDKLQKYTGNSVGEDDKNRILGHVLVLFDNMLHNPI